MVARSLARSSHVLRASAAARQVRLPTAYAARFASSGSSEPPQERTHPSRLMDASKPLWEIQPGADKEGRHEQKMGSDVPWMLGSAAVFLPWVNNDQSSPDHTQIGYMLFTGDGHDAHKPNSDAVHTPRGQHGEEGDAHVYKNIGKGKGGDKDSDDEGSDEGADEQEDDSGDSPSAQDVKNSVKSAVAANAPKPAMDKESKGKSKSASGGDEQQSGGDDSGDEPSQADIAASLKRAERTAVPRAAMDEEHKGHGDQADLDKK